VAGAPPQEAAKAPESAPPPNRDRHGNADVAAYIAQWRAPRAWRNCASTRCSKSSNCRPSRGSETSGADRGFRRRFAKSCPEGVVFASDIEPRQLDVVRAKIHSTGMRNIVPVLASEDDPHFPPASLDIVFMATRITTSTTAWNT
jgi:hypothetical protein